jgi:tetratricopeptide (TPR) repeat protein
MAAALVLATRVLAAPPDPTQDLPILDVPFLPQTEALCGGAAAAMVLRYWGERGIDAGDFASLVEPAAGGIRTGRLVADLERRGYRALAFAGTGALIRQHLAAGRPVIALIEDHPRVYHYVVLVAWPKGALLLHDPATAPFRVVPDPTFDTRWAATGHWSLLILPGAQPPATSGTLPTETDSTHEAVVSSAPGAWASLVAEGVQLGRAGDLDAAALRLQAATALWPDSAFAWRELAGTRFRQQRWPAAAMLARRAARLAPGDPHTWRLLGASSFLAGRINEALDAWNRVGEPRLDLTRIDGLGRTRFAVVADALGLDSGALLTARSFRRARRRLADLPTFASSRLDCRPLPGGVAEVEVRVLDRPLFLNGPADAAALAARALTERELALSLASPTGSGELWAAAWRWEEHRPSVRVAVSGPGVAGLPGMLKVEGFGEQQTYDAALVTAHTRTGDAIPQGTALHSGQTVREVRRGVGVAWGEWLDAKLRGETNLGLERWEGQGRPFLTMGLALDLRPVGDALSLRLETARWLVLGRGQPFSIGAAGAVWRPAVPGLRHTVVEARAGYRAASAEAPPTLGPGAGTGRGRPELLRAHPLLAAGIVRGPAFGRSLWNAGLEFGYRPWQLGLLRAGLACFVDAARAGDQSPAQVDAGVGIRLAGFGPDGELALNAARGLRDGAAALSLVWRTRRG